MDRLWRFYSTLICSAAQTLQQVLQAILEQFLRLHRLRLSLLASGGRLAAVGRRRLLGRLRLTLERLAVDLDVGLVERPLQPHRQVSVFRGGDRKSTRLNYSH